MQKKEFSEGKNTGKIKKMLKKKDCPVISGSPL